MTAEFSKKNPKQTAVINRFHAIKEAGQQALPFFLLFLSSRD